MSKLVCKQKFSLWKIFDWNVNKKTILITKPITNSMEYDKNCDFIWLVTASNWYKIWPDAMRYDATQNHNKVPTASRICLFPKKNRPQLISSDSEKFVHSNKFDNMMLMKNISQINSVKIIHKHVQVQMGNPPIFGITVRNCL